MSKLTKFTLFAALALLIALGAALLHTPERHTTGTHSLEIDETGHQNTAGIPQSEERATSTTDETLSEWLVKWRDASDEATQTALLYQGTLVANKHRQKIEALIESAPDAALAESISYFEYAQLPNSIKALVEEPFSEVSDIDVAIGCSDSHSHMHYRMKSQSGGTSTLHMPAKHRVALCKRKIPVQGIRLNGKAVPRGDVFQVVDGNEAEWLAQHWPSGQVDDKNCYLSGEPIVSEPIVAVSGGSVFYFQNTESVYQLEEIFSEADAQPGLDIGSTWMMQAELADGFPIEEFQAQVASTALQTTTETKTILVILVDFSDIPGQPFDPTTVEQTLDGVVNNAFQAYSYNQVSLDGTVTDYTIRAQHSSDEYFGDSGYDLHDEIVASYIALGSPTPFLEYDSVCIAFPSIAVMSAVGRADIGGQRIWMNGTVNSHTFTHELGHNYSLMHANYWDFEATNPNSTNPVDPTGSNTEYGDPYDRMGSSWGSNLETHHFHMPAKQSLGWINDTQWEDVQLASGSGTYRIFRFDDINASGLQALRLPKSATNDHYWIGYRYDYRGDATRKHGAYLLWERADGTPERNQSWLVDTTPGSILGKQDAGISIGQTYSDSASNIHITLIDKGGTSPNQYIDVTVNFGEFPSNVAPSGSISGPSTATARTPINFSANASDANGDTLAYSWDMGDGTFAENSPTITHSWIIGGSYDITLTISDMKGGSITLTSNVTVSDPLDTWFERTSGLSEDILGVAANQTHVVAVSDANTILRSVDGANWVDVSPPDIYKTGFKDVIWTGSEFYTVGYFYDSAISGQRGVIYKSTTGQIWTLDYIIPTAQVELIEDRNSGLFGITFDGASTLVAVGKGATVLRKDESDEWLSVSTSVTSTHIFEDIAYGDGYFVFVGHDRTPSYSGDVAVYRSTDGQTWEDVSNRTGLDSLKDFREIEFIKGAFHASGHYSRAWMSIDNGQTWSAAQTGNRQTIAGFTSIGDLRYAVGLDHGDSSVDIDLLSTDGLKWTPVYPGSIEDRREMVAFNNTFITVGNSGSIRQSAPLNPDNDAPNASIEGPNTTDARQLTLFTADALDLNGDTLAYIWDMGDGIFAENSPSITHSWVVGGNYTVKLTVSDMMGGYVTTTKNVTVSDPLDTWFERTSGLSEDILGVAANQTHVVAVSDANTILRSVDGANWVDVSPPDIYKTGFKDVIWTGSEFYTVGYFYDSAISGQRGVIYKSTTGQIWTLDYIIPTAQVELIEDRNSGLFGITFDGASTLVAVGKGATVLRKDESDEWLSVSTSVTSTHIFEDIAYGDGYFVFVGHDRTPSYSGDVAVYRSTDGQTWEDVSNRTGLDSLKDFREIEFIKGAFHASGHYSRAWMSIDNGQTWSAAQTGNRQTIAGFTSIGDLRYAVGLDHGDSSVDIDLLSTDGLKWTPVYPGSIEDRREMVAFNNTFITVGNSGSIRQSAPITSSQGYQVFSSDYFQGGAIDAEGTSNPDFDWANNLIEYALGGNPESSTDTPDQPTMYFDDSNYAVFKVVRDSKQQDIAYSVWWSHDLETWTRANLTIIEDTTTSLKVRTNQTYNEKDKAFFRLQLDQ